MTQPTPEADDEALYAALFGGPTDNTHTTPTDDDELYDQLFGDHH